MRNWNALFLFRVEPQHLTRVSRSALMLMSCRMRNPRRNGWEHYSRLIPLPVQVDFIVLFMASYDEAKCPAVDVLIRPG
jgi:hypothetical protein